VLLLFVREPVEVEHHHRRAAVALAMLRRCLRDCRCLLSGHHLLKNCLAEGSLFRVQVGKKDAPHLHGGRRQGLLGFPGSKGSARRFKLPKTKEQFLVICFPPCDVRNLIRHGRPFTRCPERWKDDLFLTVVMGVEEFREAPREFCEVLAIAVRNGARRHPDDRFHAPSEGSMHQRKTVEQRRMLRVFGSHSAKLFDVSAVIDNPGRNVYLWESEEAARSFFTPELAQRIKGLYGVPARIEFAEVAALVDNAAVRGA
jgi:hypothetical protein